MKNIFNSIFDKLFGSKNSSNKLFNDLKSDSRFKTKEDMENSNVVPIPEHIYKLKTGHVETIKCPNLENWNDVTPVSHNMILTKWYFKVGDMVKHGDVICDVESERYTMEFESFYEGRLIWCCELNKELVPGSEICKIEGVSLL